MTPKASAYCQDVGSWSVPLLGRYRRLSKDYEQLPESSEAMIYAAMRRLMLRRLAANPALAL